MKRTDVFVYCELAGAELAEVGLEMLGPAAKMAEKYGGCACAVLIGGGDLDKAAAQAALYGAGRVIEVSGDEYAKYSCDAYTHALTKLCRKYEPAALMIGSTPLGRDLAPRVACRLKTGLTADVTDISFNDELGCINWIMPAYRRAWQGAVPDGHCHKQFRRRNMRKYAHSLLPYQEAGRERLKWQSLWRGSLL